MRSRVAALVSATALGCVAEPPPRDARQVLYERVCHAVVATYRLNARPSSVEVEIPGARPDDPPSKVMLAAPNLPLAEQCLGLPMPPPATLAATVRVEPALPRAVTATSSSRPAPSSKIDPLDSRE